jgi:hypothetical protein
VVGHRTLEAAAGTGYLSVRLDLAPGAEDCVIDDWPTVTLLDRGTVVDVPVRNADGQGELGDGVWVTADKSAVITLGWAFSHHCGDVDNDLIRLALPAGGDLGFAGFGRTTCSPGEGPQTVQLLAPRPATDYGPHRQHSRWEDVEATGDLDLSADPGSTIEFEVTLTAAEDIPLGECPDYSILTGGGEVTYGLNCAEVPYHDERGRPYLPADTPVAFAMQADAGPVSTPKLLWLLDAPGHPGVSGTLRVGDDDPAATGTVSGIVTMDGGPALGTSRKVTVGTVMFFDAADEEHDADIGPDGTYEIELPAGRYRVLVASDQWSASNAFDDGEYGVTGGTAQQLDISLPIR